MEVTESPAVPERLFFTLEDLALRWDCHPHRVRSLIQKKHLRALRVARLLRVSRGEVERYERETVA